MFQEFRCHILSIYIFSLLVSKAWFSDTARITVSVISQEMWECGKNSCGKKPVPVSEAEDLNMIVLETGKGAYEVKDDSFQSV